MKIVAAGAVIIVVALASVWLWTLQNRDWSPRIQHKGMVVSGWNSAMGAVDENGTNFDKQKLSYWATVWNDSMDTSYVADVKIKLPDSMRAHILSGDTVLSVNQSVAPNASYEVKGEIVLDTKGMTKQDILNLGKIEGFTVETAQKLISYKPVNFRDYQV